MSAFIDITGNKYGMLTVMHQEELQDGNANVIVEIS